MKAGELERLADLVADRIAERLAGRLAPAARLVTAQEAAHAFGVDRGWIYANAERLGAIRLGTGPRAQLRIDITQAAARLPSERPAEPDPAPQRHSRRRVSQRPSNGVPLLPVRGKEPAL